MLYKSWLTPANVPILSSVLRNQFTGALHDHLRPRRGAVMPCDAVMPWAPRGAVLRHARHLGSAHQNQHPAIVDFLR